MWGSIIVVHLHSEKGELAGEVQVSSYSVNTETTGTVDVVTDPTLSKSAPLVWVDLPNE